MKKFVTIAALSLVCSLSAMAAQFTVSAICTPFTFPFPNGAGSGSLSCPSFASTGAVGAIDIASMTLNLYADYQAGNPTTIDQTQQTFTLVNGVPTAPVSWAANTINMTVTGSFSSGGSNPTSPHPVAASDARFGTAASLGDFTAFSVAVSSVLQSGTVTTSSAGAIETFVYDTAVTTGTPEPISMLLLGTGLLGLSLVGRRKFVRKS